MQRNTQNPATLATRFVLLFGIWLVITGFAASAWPVGAIAAATGTVLSRSLLPRGHAWPAPGPLLRLLAGFLWGSIRGGFDVASRAFHPRAPLRPAWLEYRLRLPEGPARVSLGNLLSLMPGTLCAGCKRELLYVHCLDREHADLTAIATEEARIAATLGIQLEPRHG
ncbi:MAG: Na+/H+ antiporter subunit E [Pseudomonadales bacterium]|nr:Na+/H+ antiporter subunit E [Pseudomonadales bacterium]